MIDILTVVYKNYALLDLQVAHWRRLGKPGIDYRLRVCDNTPAGERSLYPAAWQEETWPEVTIYQLDAWGIDGETHGQALDFLVSRAESPLVGIVDTDFFWLYPDILAWAWARQGMGLVCAGCAGCYPDWQRVIDPRYPERSGEKAPVCWGMFVDRALAGAHSFVCTAAEAGECRETGWRLREWLIQANAPRQVLPGAADPGDPELTWFGEPARPMGVHFLKGSGGRRQAAAQLPALIEKGMKLWAQDA